MPKPVIMSTIILILLAACMISENFMPLNNNRLFRNYAKSHAAVAWPHKTGPAQFDFAGNLGNRIVTQAPNASIQEFLSSSDGFIWYDNYQRDDEITFLREDTAYHMVVNDIEIKIPGLPAEETSDRILVWDGNEIRKLR